MARNEAFMTTAPLFLCPCSLKEQRKQKEEGKKKGKKNIERSTVNDQRQRIYKEDNNRKRLNRQKERKIERKIE